jgi:hypothetical protein
MIDWRLLTYINKVKYRNILLIVEDIESVEKYIKNPLITMITEDEFINYSEEISYSIIVTWGGLLYLNPTYQIYGYLAKMNFLLKDNGIIMCRVLSHMSHITKQMGDIFLWNSSRIDSIGRSKMLKRVGKIDTVDIDRGLIRFLRFNYAPDI